MRILIAGDFCPRDRVVRSIEEGRPIFSESFLQWINKVDYAIINFECAVADASMKPIPKCGPHLRCSRKAMAVLKDAGFHCVTLANNHFRDFGCEGVDCTLETLKNTGLDYLGGGRNIIEANTTLFKRINGKSIAFINVSENEVSRRIKDARKSADFVILIVHGGHEHFQYPSPRMKKLYRFFVEMGADSVINHHQHCFSGCEVYQGKPIFYGLGNLCFDHPKKRNDIWNEGYMAVLCITESGVQYETAPYIQCNENPIVEMMNDKEKDLFQHRFMSLCETIADDGLLEKEFKVFFANVSQSVITPFTPYFCEYTRAAVGRHYLPYLIPKNKMANMLNYVLCESHRDLLTLAMQERLEK